MMTDENKGRAKTVPATKDYVDQSIDAQRQFAENLFSKSEGRVKLILDHMVEAKLKEALATIRPEKESTLRRPQTTRFIGKDNMDHLKLLRDAIAEAVLQYEFDTGLRVRSVFISRTGNFIDPKVLAHTLS
jgi:hypothetical protein